MWSGVGRGMGGNGRIHLRGHQGPGEAQGDWEATPTESLMDHSPYFLW